MDKLGLSGMLSDWASKYQDQCLTNFNKVGIPSGRAEYWRFVPSKLWDSSGSMDTEIAELSSNPVISHDNRPDLYLDFFDGVVDQTSLKNLSEKLIGSEISGFENAVFDNDHWAKDSKIDRTELGEESIKIPQLHRLIGTRRGQQSAVGR